MEARQARRRGQRPDLPTSRGAAMSRHRGEWKRHRTDCGGSFHSAGAKAGCGLAIRKTITDASRQARPLARKARR